MSNARMTKAAAYNRYLERQHEKKMKELREKLANEQKPATKPKGRRLYSP
jgi:hypothetical protein